MTCLLRPYISLVQFRRVFSFLFFFFSFCLIWGIYLTCLHTNPFFCGGHSVKSLKVLDFSYFIFSRSRFCTAFVLWFPFPHLFTHFSTFSCDTLILIIILIITIVKLPATANIQVIRVGFCFINFA